MMVRKTKPKEDLKQSVGFALDPENLRTLDTFVAEKDSLIASRNLLNPFPHACASMESDRKKGCSMSTETQMVL